MTAPIEAAVSLHSSVWAAKDAEARRLRAKARRQGAALDQVAEALRLRDQRIAEEVTVWEADDE